MSSPILMTGSSMTNLQATIAAGTAGQTDQVVLPHHPITCTSGLYYDDEGILSCDHAIAPFGNQRTQASLNHSVACLIIELGCQL